MKGKFRFAVSGLLIILLLLPVTVYSKEPAESMFETGSDRSLTYVEQYIQLNRYMFNPRIGAFICPHNYFPQIFRELVGVANPMPWGVYAGAELKLPLLVFFSPFNLQSGWYGELRLSNMYWDIEYGENRSAGVNFGYTGGMILYHDQRKFAAVYIALSGYSSARFGSLGDALTGDFHFSPNTNASAASVSAHAYFNHRELFVQLTMMNMVFREDLGNMQNQSLTAGYINNRFHRKKSGKYTYLMIGGMLETTVRYSHLIVWQADWKAGPIFNLKF